MTIVLDKEFRALDFVIIGTQKGGTTWLRQVLREHPAVYIPPRPEEVHFFNRSMLQPDLYLALFDVAEASGKMIGEKSPNYFHMPEKCIAFMKQLQPNAKIIILLRNPVERAWSQARMSVSGYNQHALRNRDFWKLMLQVAGKGNFERTNYGTVIQRWSKYFSKEQILVYFYDDLEADAQSFLNRVCSDLGLEAFTPKALRTRVHVSKTYNMPNLLTWFLQWRYKNITTQLLALGYQVPTAWKSQVVQVNGLKKLGVILAYLPFAAVTTIGYLLYRAKEANKIQVPQLVRR
jgi:hypothetical protein